MRQRIKWIALRVMVVLVCMAVVFLVGPRPTIDTHIKHVVLPADIDHHLAQSEAQFSDIVPGTEKIIFWANEEKTKTPYSIVYLHGFSATRQETAPLSDEIAHELGANLFYTRLTGHGRTGAALVQATVNNWLNDTIEALEIGKRLGDRVIVIGTSTGGTLATWLATQPQTDSVLAYILISPNFALYNSTSEILTWPWANQWAQLFVGAEYYWTPESEAHGRYWTNRYPSTALVTMMSLVVYVRDSELERITTPVLIIYSPKDTVVNPQEIERRYAQFGSATKKLVPMIVDGLTQQHVLAGDIRAPENTQKVKEIILEFLAQVRNAQTHSRTSGRKEMRVQIYR